MAELPQRITLQPMQLCLSYLLVQFQELLSANIVPLLKYINARPHYDYCSWHRQAYCVMFKLKGNRLLAFYSL